MFPVKTFWLTILGIKGTGGVSEIRNFTPAPNFQAIRVAGAVRWGQAVLQPVCLSPRSNTLTTNWTRRASGCCKMWTKQGLELGTQAWFLCDFWRHVVTQIDGTEYYQQVAPYQQQPEFTERWLLNPYVLSPLYQPHPRETILRTRHQTTPAWQPDHQFDYNMDSKHFSLSTHHISVRKQIPTPETVASAMSEAGVSGITEAVSR